jgi:hypothetical protein
MSRHAAAGVLDLARYVRNAAVVPVVVTRPE